MTVTTPAYSRTDNLSHYTTLCRANLNAKWRGQAGVELGLGLPELGLGVGVGDYAVAGADVRGGAVYVCAADAHRPGAVAGGIDPADGPCVAAPIEALVGKDPLVGEVAGPAAHGRGRVQGVDQLEHRRRRLEEPSLDQRREVLDRSEEHTSELQSLMRISYAVFCLKKKN